jgi:hypothetical protein
MLFYGLRQEIFKKIEELSSYVKSNQSFDAIDAAPNKAT